jgi:vesicle transport through interaction with t-SNAREs protein 1
LLDNSERLERTGNQLQEGYRIAIETEQIGTQVLSNLSSQREQIQRSRNRLRETQADLGRSSRVMNTMIMRSIRDKFVLYIIGVVFVLAVSLTIYFSIK